MLTRLFKKEPENTGQPVVLLIGFGNPGREYRLTRHNVGFMVIDRISQNLGINMSRVQSRALIATAPLGEVRLVLAKPQTFMNLSGQAVSGLIRFYKVPLDRLLVIHDDLDLPVGTLRLRPGGGSAGQKGLASTIQQLGTQEFPRMRLGIGRPPGQMDAADYVLHGFERGDEEIVNLMLDRAVEAARVFALEGLEKAMNTFNGSLLKE